MAETHTDEEIEVPPQFYLTHSKLDCLLAVMVHRKSPDLHEDPSSLKPGSSRIEQRAATAQRVQEERATARSAREDFDDSILQYKKMKLAAAEAVVTNQVINGIQAQIKMFQDNKEAFIAIEGEINYYKHIMGLLKSMPRPVRHPNHGNIGPLPDVDPNESAATTTSRMVAHVTATRGLVGATARAMASGDAAERFMEADMAAREPLPGAAAGAGEMDTEVTGV